MVMTTLPIELYCEILAFLRICDSMCLLMTTRQLYFDPFFWRVALNEALQSQPLHCDHQEDFSQKSLDQLQRIAIRSAALQENLFSSNPHCYGIKRLDNRGDKVLHVLEGVGLIITYEIFTDSGPPILTFRCHDILNNKNLAQVMYPITDMHEFTSDYVAFLRNTTSVTSARPYFSTHTFSFIWDTDGSNMAKVNVLQLDFSDRNFVEFQEIRQIPILITAPETWTFYVHTTLSDVTVSASRTSELGETEIAAAKVPIYELAGEFDFESRTSMCLFEHEAHERYPPANHILQGDVVSFIFMRKCYGDGAYRLFRASIDTSIPPNPDDDSIVHFVQLMCPRLFSDWDPQISIFPDTSKGSVAFIETELPFYDRVKDAFILTPTKDGEPCSLRNLALETPSGEGVFPFHLLRANSRPAMSDPGKQLLAICKTGQVVNSKSLCLVDIDPIRGSCTAHELELPSVVITHRRSGRSDKTLDDVDSSKISLAMDFRLGIVLLTVIPWDTTFKLDFADPRYK